MPPKTVACTVLLSLLCTAAAAAPFIPRNDAEIVERLPAATDPALRRVDSLRRQLASRPDDIDLRLDIARRYFDLAMAQGDPRYVGYASSALAPLDKAAPADARYWLARGLVQQYQHDFDAALASLAKSSALAPDAPEPVGWRAAIHMVQARPQQALAECRRLTEIGAGLYAQGCAAYAQAASGQLADAYRGLDQAVAQASNVPPELALWLHTRLAEMAVRLDKLDAAQRHFSLALQQGVTDQFLLGAYADFLLLRDRPAEAMQLLTGWERSDILLLRLALAARSAKDPRAGDWSRQLRERFEAAARRGDKLHEQEAARFALDIDGKPAEALALARSNYVKQKEPRDAEILMRAALAARDPKAAQPALDWLRASRFEDPQLQRLADQLVAGGAAR
jgi:Tfp pilus assembly protein PilF